MENIKNITPKRKIILCFVSYYLPGFRSGGPVRTIANFVDHLGDEFDIRIVTRDHDALVAEPYPNVVIDAWNTVGKAQVFYASDKMVNLRGIATLLSETSHDVLYLNSFFAFGFTGLPLLARRLGFAPRTPCVIAPRGEFSVGAVTLKATKKQIYMGLVKALGLYQNLHWQASSDFEKADISREFGSVARWVYVAPDLTPVVTPDLNTTSSRAPGPLRFVFLSRISPMKNLDFLLRVLAKVSINVKLAIYGPQEDLQYWEHCLSLIKQLPENINVTLGGNVPQKQVRKVFSEHDVFVFPTRGENFGHVIFESLSAGTPVLVSDQTPWQSDGHGGIQVLSLDEPLWVDTIELWARFDEESLVKRHAAATDYAIQYTANNLPLQQNREVFYTAAMSTKQKRL